MLFMKQMKFFLVTLMVVLMGVSVTSCLKGDDNTEVQAYTVAKVTDNMFAYVSFLDISGYKMISKNIVTELSNVNSGDFIYMLYTYDTKTDVDPNSQTINITVNAAQKISGNSVNGITEEMDADDTYASDRPVIEISNEYSKPLMFDNYNLVIPIQYYAKENIDKHKFSLVYYTDKLKGKEENAGLTLYLRHQSEETGESLRYFSYRTFDLKEVLSAYKEEYGSFPANIIIRIEKNSLSNGEVPTKTTPVSFEYKYNDKL